MYGLNASGPAPQQLSADLVRHQGYEQFPTVGGLTVTVPGSLRGWQLALERFGSMGLDSLLQRPIAYARNGFPVSQRIARAWKKSTEKMGRLADSRRVWLPNGRSPRAAELFKNPEFAQTLETIASEGYDALYMNDIGSQIAEAVQADGGVLAQSDLAAYQAEWVEPINLAYRDGFVFHEIPPNGQGLTALLALNLARKFDLPALGYGSAEYYHTLIEAMKLAFADAHAYIADPRHVPVPVHAMLSDRYTQSRLGLIQPDRSITPTPGTPSTNGDTVYLRVADGRGHMVSWIQSLYMGFGSGITAGKTGVQLQNRGANFSLEPGHPNEAAPGKRPFHTIIPGFITRNGEAFSSFGVMGGFMQPQGHLQVGLNLIDFGMDPQTALDAPRFNWLANKRVALETAVSDDIRQNLAQRGHELVEKRSPLHYGGGQVIVRLPGSGVLVGGSEPRNDGTAVGW